MKLDIAISIVVIVVLSSFLGVSGGYYAGKADVFERILNDKIECSLTVNPLSMGVIE